MLRNNLIHARKSKNLSQKQVASILNKSERQYQHIEAGTRGTSEENWLKLFDLFGKVFPLNELMENTATDESLKFPNNSDSSTKKITYK